MYLLYSFFSHLCCMIIACFVWLFFFFKQKTAYEMRISDWSSDVCSSDLCEPRYRQRAGCRGNGGDDRVSRSSRDQSQAIETLGAGHRRRFSHAAHKPFARRFLVAQVLADQRQSHAVGSRVSCTQATDRAGKAATGTLYQPHPAHPPPPP